MRPAKTSFRVIQGGKSAAAGPTGDAPVPADVPQLLRRVSTLRDLLSLRPNDVASGLVDDMEEAITALRRLERSRHPDAAHRAAEYRMLAIEIDAEIAAMLKDA